MAKRGRAKKSLSDKVNEIDPNFLEASQSLTIEQLKNRIVELSKYELAVLSAKKEDLDLQRIQESLAVANEGYKTAVKGTKVKVAYLHELLSSKGA